MNEKYKEVIDVLLSGEKLDPQAILTIIIKEHPDVFVEAFRIWMANGDSEVWKLEVIQRLYSGHTIKAIQLVRVKTGLGLREAKH